jgi:uncharacterized membrane protein (UPF0127 family)
MARSLLSQIIGLIGKRQRADLFLVIPHCRSIHTWFMRSAIDIVFLDVSHEVVAVVEEGPPWRIFNGPRSGRFVLELPPGHVRKLGLAVRDTAILRDT